MIKWLYAAGLCAASLCARSAHAQYLTRPALEWRTVTTPHFAIHYPVEFAEWSAVMAERMEAVHDAVSAFVGYAPAARVTIIVEDPRGESNGFALPFRNDPVIFFWPTPPAPTSVIGDTRSWPEMLAVHEYAHIAHLTRPSRNPGLRRLWGLLPVKLGPITVNAPRWVIEGYATYVEGRLTGSGRPHGAWRPAILRQWALEGRLPRYGELDGTSAWQGGGMAYLAGSAFIEWLVERNGEASLVNVWKRMTARQKRGFTDAFAGVYGATPDELYGRFTVEVTARALQVERQIGQGGLVPGQAVQKLARGTGGPALSRDGALLALTIASRTDPRVVVWKTVDEPEDSTARRARERARALDPEDVPGVQWGPRAKRVVATLRPAAGVPFLNPRFLPDGRHVLVVRDVALGDGAERPDLFVWDIGSGDVRRVTRGASIRSADPSPDGRFAVGDRCTGGHCDVVRVDLATGAIQTLVRGSPVENYYRPRYSPDGSRVAVSVQRAGRWRIATLDAAGGGAPELVDPDDGANRYDVAYLPDGRSAVLVSERGGIPNVEHLDLSTHAARLVTRVTGAALAPEPARGSDDIYFLTLRASGFDLNRIADVPTASDVVTVDARLAPAAAMPVTSADTFARQSPSAPRSYRLGPRSYRLWPSGESSAGGSSATVTLASTDPIGRLTWLAQGVAGTRGAWRGVAASAAFRGLAPTISAELFSGSQHPSAQGRAPAGVRALDVDYRGGDLIVDRTRILDARRHEIRIGASAGTLGGTMGYDGARDLAFSEYRGGFVQSRGRSVFSEAVTMHGALGRTAGDDWARAVASIALAYSALGYRLRGEATGGITGGGTSAFERFAVGGLRAPLFDPSLLSQRLAMPVLPVGVATGRTVATYRVSLAGLIAEPYVWTAHAEDDRPRAWHRVIGAETQFDVAAIGFVGVPAVRVLGGAGYSLDPPLRHKVRAYLSVTLRP